MNIFDRKAQTTPGTQLPLSPVELYQTCAYKEGYGYLRGIQEEVLNAWHEKRIQRDTICKMSTGSGKTLTGLLMLYSKLIEKAGPCLYVCPDPQLLNQTIELANLYGIPVCTFNGSNFPPDFINEKSILVCHFHKLFNGKSVFNKHNIKLGGILLDDAHKCVDLARDQTTIKLPRNHVISKRLFDLFTDSLKEQLPGTFFRLEHGDPTMLMKVPYWSWIDNHQTIIKIISEYVSKIDSDFDNKESIKFNWNLVANNLLAYDCYIGSDEIEISPIHVPYHEIPSFNEAKHRFILSATFEDDYDLIKDLGISHESISNPIVPLGRKDVGKRLIIAPSRFAPSIEDEQLREFVSLYVKETYNVIVLVPSGAKAKAWIEQGAVQVDKDNIETALDTLKNTKGNFMVFVNRYDGVDLHNDLCRVLVIDGLPKFTSLPEQYTEVRLESMRAGKKAQIIEQGLGRATRSGGDFSVTYLMGSDLMSFMGYEVNLQYFTSVTRAHIKAGLGLLEGEASSDPLQTIKEVANYCLTQHKSWLDYHTKIILEIPTEEENKRKSERLFLAEIERQAIEKFRRRDYEEAATLILTNITRKEDILPKELAWYYQFAAQLMYLQNIADSNNLQVKANTITTHMFYPKHSPVIYRALKNKGIQAAEIKKNLEEFSTPQDILIYINNILSGLVYSPEVDFNLFENKLAELGRFFGFAAQMPEKEIGNGPDVLWCLTGGHYLILEAKSNAIHNEISRDNINQLLGSETWFKKQYPGSEYTPVTLQKPNKKGNAVNISDNMKVLDQENLENLHNNLKQFVNALQGIPTNSYSTGKIEELLQMHGFTPELFLKKYLKPIK
jgi:hypothetical protein